MEEERMKEYMLLQGIKNSRIFLTIKLAQNVVEAAIIKITIQIPKNVVQNVVVVVKYQSHTFVIVPKILSCVRKEAFVTIAVVLKNILTF